MIKLSINSGIYAGDDDKHTPQGGFSPDNTHNTSGINPQILFIIYPQASRQAETQWRLGLMQKKYLRAQSNKSF